MSSGKRKVQRQDANELLTSSSQRSASKKSQLNQSKTEDDVSELIVSVQIPPNKRSYPVTKNLGSSLREDNLDNEEELENNHPIKLNLEYEQSKDNSRMLITGNIPELAKFVNPYKIVFILIFNGNILFIFHTLIHSYNNVCSRLFKKYYYLECQLLLVNLLLKCIFPIIQ